MTGARPGILHDEPPDPAVRVGRRAGPGVPQRGLWDDVDPVPLPPPAPDPDDAAAGSLDDGHHVLGDPNGDGADDEPAPQDYLDAVAASAPPAVVPSAIPAPDGVTAPFGLDLFGNAVQAPRPKGAIAGKFVFPPFSVLDARQGAWLDRKRAWAAMGIRGDDGRGENEEGATGDARMLRKQFTDWMQEKTGGNRGTATGTSVFDPVLCELAYRWFCPPGGSVLDPFAGEATKGIVAAALGYAYTGVELRQAQVDANNRQAAAAGVAPTWVQGDSAQVGTLVPPGQLYDMVWTSPPYYDLEQYSDSDQDGSAKQTYAQFMVWYEDIFKQCVAHLRDRRFLAVKVGEIRDDVGTYRNFVGDNTTVFRRLGLHYYNELILVTAVGSLPIRIGKQFAAGRKIGKTHQQVLVYWKGDPAKINQEVGTWPMETDT